MLQENLCLLLSFYPEKRTTDQLFPRRSSQMPPILGRSQGEILIKSHFLDITLSFPRRGALKQTRTPVASSFLCKVKKPAATQADKINLKEKIMV